MGDGGKKIRGERGDEMVGELADTICVAWTGFC